MLLPTRLLPNSRYISATSAKAFMKRQYSLEASLENPKFDKITPKQKPNKQEQPKYSFNDILIDSKNHSLQPLHFEGANEVPTLSHGLSEVLFKPGIHYMRDPVSNNNNYSDFLLNVTQPEDFDFSKISGFMPPSEHENLHKLSKRFMKKYMSSTSAMSSVLIQLYFLISHWKPPKLSNFSKSLRSSATAFSRSTRYPPTVNVIYKEYSYALDSDKSNDKKYNVLSLMGHSIERHLVYEQERYEKYLIKSKISEPLYEADCFNYCGFENFIIRSQIDCRHDSLRKKSFDIKSRAVVSIRHNIEKYKEFNGYQIKTEKGKWESFEREIFDMIRTSMIKYAFQARMGNMDGIFVAYHNTVKMFGFQYFPLDFIDEAIFYNPLTARRTFYMIMSLYGGILDRLTAMFPERNMSLSFSPQQNTQNLILWVELPNFYKDHKPVPNTEEGFDIDINNDGNSTFPSLTPVNAEMVIPLKLESKKDEWKLVWDMVLDKSSESVIRQEYYEFKTFQKNYFKKDYTDKYYNNPFVKKLLELSKESAYLNEQ
ncbi:hypothetical protein BB560_000095 [Smittium megazygosporum]|uniref:Pet127-domain-containing protein n=1 Tax=Smittium megazygosporum TaxID=133381 RepID=A0A2T9ZL97_9FUNG|nr:hypothetical protein BB560_000095 [Smittium megazygosporum]